MLSQKSELKIGDSFFLVPRYSKQDGFVGVVTKIGKKYFYINQRLQFELKTYHNVSTGAYTYDLYRSEQEYFDFIEKRKLWGEIRQKYNFQAPPCSLEQLKAFMAILEENSND